MDGPPKPDLQEAMWHALVQIAAQQNDPHAYLEATRLELESVLTKHIDRQPENLELEHLCATMNKMIDEIWPEILKRLSN